MAPIILQKGSVVRGCLDIVQTNGFNCEMVLVVYADGELKQISQRTLDLINDGVYETYIETDELTINQDDTLVKLMIINNFKDLYPYKY